MFSTARRIWTTPASKHLIPDVTSSPNKHYDHLRSSKLEPHQTFATFAQPSDTGVAGRTSCASPDALWILVLAIVDHPLCEGL